MSRREPSRRAYDSALKEGHFVREVPFFALRRSLLRSKPQTIILRPEEQRFAESSLPLRPPAGTASLPRSPVGHCLDGGSRLGPRGQHALDPHQKGGCPRAMAACGPDPSL